MYDRVGRRGLRRAFPLSGVLTLFKRAATCGFFDGSFAGFLEPQPHLFLDASGQKLIGFQTATNEAAYAFTDFPVGFPEELEAGGQPCPDFTARSPKDLRRD